MTTGRINQVSVVRVGSDARAPPSQPGRDAAAGAVRASPRMRGGWACLRRPSDGAGGHTPRATAHDDNKHCGGWFGGVGALRARVVWERVTASPLTARAGVSNRPLNSHPRATKGRRWGGRRMEAGRTLSCRVASFGPESRRRGPDVVGDGCTGGSRAAGVGFVHSRLLIE